MDINIISTKEEKLWGRKDIEFSVKTPGSTVSKDDVKVELCKKLNLNPDSTIITKINQEFGDRSNLCYAHSYSKKEDLQKFEPEYLLKRMSGKNAEAPAEHKAEAEKKEKGEAKEKPKKEHKEEAAPE